MGPLTDAEGNRVFVWIDLRPADAEADMVMALPEIDWTVRRLTGILPEYGIPHPVLDGVTENNVFFE